MYIWINMDIEKKGKYREERGGGDRVDKIREKRRQRVVDRRMRTH